jgi:hypothetical protein
MNLAELLMDPWNFGLGYTVFVHKVLQGALGQLIPLFGIDESCAMFACSPGPDRRLRFIFKNRLLLPLKVFAVVKFYDWLGCAEIAVIPANGNDMKSSHARASIKAQTHGAPHLDRSRGALGGSTRHRKIFGPIPTIVHIPVILQTIVD